MASREKDMSVLKAAQSGDLPALKSALHDEEQKLAMCRNSGGDTPLLLAARHGHVDVLRYLHEELALSLEQANADQKRALHEAAGASRPECVLYLLSHGAQVDSFKRADW